MNQLRNHVQLIGNLGSTPELKEISKGKFCTRVSIATNEVYYNQRSEKVTQTQWHQLIAWGPIAKSLCELTEMGSRVAISGKLQHSNYKDKDGNVKYVTEVSVQSFMLFTAVSEAA